MRQRLLALLADCSSGDAPSEEESPLATAQGEGESSYHLSVHVSRGQQASIDGVRIATSGGEDYETDTANKYAFGNDC